MREKPPVQINSISWIIKFAIGGVCFYKILMFAEMILFLNSSYCDNFYSGIIYILYTEEYFTSLSLINMLNTTANIINSSTYSTNEKVL